MATINKIIFIILLMFLILSCINPFAPKLDETGSSSEFDISDLSNIDGVFRNFQYAYTFKDTLIYGEILNRDFVFSFRDYEIGADVSWGRDEEMKIHHGLFQNTQRLDLVWNKIISMSMDSTNIIRSFNLTVTFNPTDIILITGKVNLTLRKTDNIWQIINWIDESNF